MHPATMVVVARLLLRGTCVCRITNHVPAYAAATSVAVHHRCRHLPMYAGGSSSLLLPPAAPAAPAAATPLRSYFGGGGAASGGAYGLPLPAAPYALT